MLDFLFVSCCRFRPWLVAAGAVVWFGTFPLVSAAADEPLFQRVDQLIEAQAGGPLAARCDDAEFVRRVYLDFIGRIPTADEVRGFLADTAADKRERLIDRLLADERYVDRLTDLFDVMLLERRGKHDEWIKFLRNSFAENKPWDQMAREILSPDAENEQSRGAAYFYVVRLERYGQNPSDMPGLVRDVGRMFLGVDVQCAQCHDHLFVDQYKQVDYQGLFAFVGNTFIRQDKQFPAIGENPLTQKVSFTSVFDGIEMTTAPRLPGGAEFELPEIAKGEEYIEPPDRKAKTPGVLKFSPIRTLGESLPTGQNPAFARNIVNRLWWMMMGRGLVDPLDLHHADNPPSHPELLDLLANEMVAHEFDIKWLLGQLARTETYQRSSVLPEGADADTPLASYRVAIERPLSPEQLLLSLRIATGQSLSDEKAMSAARDRFEKAFANPPKEPEISVNPTVKAALFLSNDDLVLSWFQKSDGALAERVAKLEEPAAAVEEIYLSVLSRLPNDEERAAAVVYLNEASADREQALRNLAWALAASTEFFVNH
ncbi:MAG: DUF1549 domain-containing protein [Pirellulaceae bacterium]